MRKKYTLSDLYASDTDSVLRDEMLKDGVLKVCKDDPALKVVRKQMYLDPQLYMPIVNGCYVKKVVRYD